MSLALEESDDDAPQLSAHARQALQEFYQEQAASASQEQDESRGKDMPQEDWVKYYAHAQILLYYAQNTWYHVI